MTRVLSYNILLGGTCREEQLAAIIHSAEADIIGLVEATNPHVIEELAHRLSMQFCFSGRSRSMRDWNIAVLSKLPILQTRVHTRPGIFTRRHVLEVEVEEANGERLTVFVAHLTSSFYNGMRSVRKRILHIMSVQQGRPHLVMGDFNSKTHGEEFKGSALIRFYRSQRDPRTPRPTLSDGVEFIRYTIRRILRLGIYSPFLIPLADRLSRVYAQGGTDLLDKAGYVDCFRQTHANDPGFTFHSSMPVGRIDYIFASPELASRLTDSNVITESEGVSTALASDHLPVYAEFIMPTRLDR